MKTRKKLNKYSSELDPEDYNQIVHKWNETDKDFPKDKTIYGLFEEQVKKIPENIALVFEEEQLTYRLLNEKSNQLARHIRARYKKKTNQDLKPDTLIALCLDRSLEMVIGILGVLKAGGAYVPIDPFYPQERVDHILKDTRAELILSQRQRSGDIRLPKDKVIYIDLTEGLYHDRGISNLPQHGKAKDLAYVIYTSGTTGKPKGVMIEQRSIVNRIHYLIQEHQIISSLRIGSKIPYTFDPSLREIFLALLSGAELIIVPSEGIRDTDKLVNYCIDAKINLLVFVPSHLNVFLASLKRIEKQKLAMMDLKIIYSCGETLGHDLASELKKHLPGIIIKNQFGPTEGCLFSLEFDLAPGDNLPNTIPVGKAINNTKVFVLDTNLTPVPIGVIGELYIGGAGLARGYLNNDELTSERFIPNPFATEEDKAKGYIRFYQTGDLVRWLPDGNLEYIGRNDDQVKIRGYRIELGEIEHALTQVPGIKQSCVLARERETGAVNNKYLVGYYVLNSDGEATTQTAILEKLSMVLPDYMVPSALVKVESFPLTINGKLDKKALPDPDFSSFEEYVAPTNEAELAICNIWQEVLGLEKVGVSDDFFRIGGNSIQAIRVSHRISTALGCELRVADIFKYKTPSRLFFHSIDQTELRIPKTNTNPSVLSFAQERLWFIEQYEEGTNAYHIPEVLELDRKTDIEGMKYALQQIVSRHEVLRSTIEQSNDQGGIQRVHDEPLTIEEVSIPESDDYQALIREDINRPFDLKTEYPIRVKFYKILSARSKNSINKSILLINIHHIASDGWSGGVFQSELFVYYEAYVNKDTKFSLPSLEIQYKDYALWQRAYLTGEVLGQQLSYWKDKLSGYQNLEFPTDYARPNQTDYSGAYQEFTLTKKTSEKLRALAKDFGTTLHSVLLSSINILLGKYTGQDDIVIGSPIANRHHRQTEGLIGFFVNTQVNRTILGKAQSYQDLIHQVHQDQIAAQIHQDLPFEKLVEEMGVERDTSRHPIFQVMFGVQSFVGDSEQIDKQRNYFKPFQGSIDSDTEKFDLSIFIDDSQEELQGEISYATSLFHKDTIARLIDHYTYLLDQLVESPQEPYGKLSLLRPEEYNQIIYEWNKTDKDFPKDKTIYGLFEEQVKKTPGNIALVFEGQQLTYKELNEKSNQLARHIRARYKKRTKQALKPDTLIALCLDRSLEMVIGILGVLKAGGAYVPIDPSYPQQRFDYIVADTKAELVLSQRHLIENSEIRLPKDKVIYIDLSEELYQVENTSNLKPLSKATNLAYVIYTSGTTGKPKGVMVEHRSITNLISDLQEKYGIESSERFLLFANYIFDASLEQLSLSLFSGGTLFVIDNLSIRDSGDLVDFIVNNRITHLHSTPSYLSTIEPTKINILRRVVFGAEYLSEDLFTKYRKVISKVINEYGPTETTITSLASINSPLLNNVRIQNIKSYVLDTNLTPVPIGVIGELYIGGAGLARGYLNNDELTSERFIPNPFATEEDKAKGYIRFYQTGDLVRWLPDGNLEYIGRNDDQVKIRGYRIELGEIEHALTQVPGIKQSCVLARERETGAVNNKYLVGYYVLNSDGEATTQTAILEKLSMVLPDYMVPSALVKVESFPLTINGKLDKKALPDPDFSSFEEYVAPTNEAELAICNIWQEVLGLEKVGVSDDFFRIGGNSIQAIRVSHRISTALGCELRVADIFKYKTPSRLFFHSIDQTELRIPKTNTNPSVLSFAQERLWFIEQYEEGTNAYHIPEVLELDRKTDIEGMKYALQQIVSRHEVLRSTIEQSNDQGGIQRVHDEPLTIEEVSIPESDDYQALIREDINRPFDLKTEYPIRVKFYKILSARSKNSINKSILLINIHHIASDGWSGGVFQSELFVYYEAYVNKDTKFSLPSLEIQYKDYALWQRAYLTGEVLGQQLSYWKDKLSGYQNLEFPTDYARPNQTDYSGAYQEFTLTKKTSEKLRALAKDFGTTLHSVLLSSINILLGKYTGQDDIVIGSPIANRHHRQTEGLIGFFVNTQVNRTILGKAQSYQDLIHQVHQDQIAAQIHQDLPFEKLVEEMGVERDTSRHPIFQVMFGVQSFVGDSEQIDKQRNYFKPFQGSIDSDTEKFDLSIFIDDSQEELQGEISYATSLFNGDTIARLTDHYIYLLDQLVESPQEPYGKLSLFRPQDYNQIIYEWNKTDKDFPKDKTIYGLFEEQVKKTPGNIALVFEGQQLTYKELNEKSNQLARHIRARYKKRTKQALKPDTLIALCLDRSLEMVIGILGVLKAGGAYVPIDPSYPQQRFDYIVADTKAELVLSQRHLIENSEIRLPKDKVIYIDLSEELYQVENTSNLKPLSKATNLAYVIYTSGTTGKPKGVMVEHRSITNLISDLQEKYRIVIPERFMLFSNYVFDASIEQIFLPLWSGGALYVIDNNSILDSSSFIDFVLSNRITQIDSTPSYLGSFDPSKFITVKRVVFGGEYLPKRVFDAYKKSIEMVINTYGPTEAAITSHISINSYLLSNTHIKNVRTYILDQRNNPVTIGVKGELYICGIGLARGYLNNEDLTAARFITNPFATEEDKARGYTRLYKTGDLVRWLSDGTLEYIGRNDDQVKIRGYRIELAEIEHALSLVPGIRQSCVLARERGTESGSTKYLVGYYVLGGHEGLTSQTTILKKLSLVLPDYMVPSVLVEMDIFPLTINGKLDKRALPYSDFSSASEDFVPPTTETEAAICQIWQQVLGLDQVGVIDDFFRIGGDSILSIQVSSRIRRLGFNCQVNDIFSHKTIAKLSKHLSGKKAIEAVQSEQGELSGVFGLLPIQQWFAEQFEDEAIKAPNHWNQSFLVKVRELDQNKLSAIIGKLVNYHDVFRVKYLRKEAWEQVYRSSITLPQLNTLDVSQHSASEIQQKLTEWQSGFDLYQGPLFQMGYLYGYKDGSARLFFALHHMIVDGVSWRILVDDTRHLYTGKSLPEKGSSYRQWVKCVKAYPTKHPEEVSYWQAQLEGMPSYDIPKDNLTILTIASLELNKTFTRSLLQKAPKAYHTEINDLLLTALAYALKDFNGNDTQGITLEGHGREVIDPSVDHSRTLGWFTTMFPVKLELQNTLKESIWSIKESLRNIPNKGIGFGAFAVDDTTSFAHKDLTPISFNYLGQFDTRQEEWQIVAEDSGMSIAHTNTDHNLIDINGMVSNGKLGFNIVTQLGEEITQQLSDYLNFHLKTIIEHCVETLEKDGSSYTPSDFKFVRLSQSLLDVLQTEARATQNEIAHVYSASSLQQGFIYHALSQTKDDAYRVQTLYDYHQSIDIEKYIDAWQACIAQYPILRTAFNWEEEIIQVIYKHGKLDYEVHDISELPTQQARDMQIETIRSEDRKRSFDLTKPTLLRLHIIKQSEDLYTIVKTEHHSISDGWSGPILLSSLHRHYRALTTNIEENIKEDTAYLEAQEYISNNKDTIADYWHKTLAEVDTANDINALLSEPIDVSSYRQVDQPATISLEIKGKVYDKLKSFSQHEGVTINVIVQLIWHKLLQVYSTNTRSIVGTTVSGRNLPIEGIEESVGLYINTLPLIIDWDNNESIRSQLHQIQEKITALSTHSYADLAKLQSKGERLFQSLFVFENYPTPKSYGKDTPNISIRNVIQKVDYPFCVVAYDQKSTLTINLKYDGRYLTKDKATLHIETLNSMLDQVIKNPNQPHGQISLLRPEEYDQIVHKWNETDKDYPKDKTIYELFEEQVKKIPESIALVFEEEQLTYRELNEKSNQLARHIRARYKKKTNQALKPDTLIALCLDRSLEMVIGILGVLKAGGAYVPIDPSYPQERLDYIIEDTQAELILSQRQRSGDIRLPKDKVIYIDLTEKLYQAENASNLKQHSKAKDLAYVIYTSGTTGKPNGVLVTHLAVVNYNQWIFNHNCYASAYILDCSSSVSFDATVSVLLTPLCNGKQVVLCAEEVKKDINLYLDFIHRYKIELIKLTPSYLSLLINTTRDKKLEYLKCIIVGGEKASKTELDEFIRLYPSVEILHHYGPTESTVGVTSFTDFDKRSFTKLETTPLGRVAINSRAYVLDTNLTPVPIGVIGELYIGGAGLARGYLNNDELTSERFIPNPFATEEDKAKGYIRFYQTGDLVRWLPDGNLEYIGRNDDQVKIRGYRIELGEIEHALTQVPGIKQSCVLARERETGAVNNKYLVGYYVLNSDGEATTQTAILEKLSMVLPDYMVPSALVKVESFPLTINGKLDKKALPDPDFSSFEEYVAPTNEAELAICNIWQEVLGLEKVGVSDDFFRIGGNSIQAIRVSHRISTALGCELRVADIFKYKTPSRLFFHSIDQTELRIPKTNTNPSVLSFAQERLWFIEQYEEGTNAYHIPEVLELDRKTDIEGMKYALQQIVSRHEVLRSTIEQSNDQGGIQRVHDEPLTIEEVSIPESDDYQALIREDINRPFDLKTEYPIRVKFYKILSARSKNSINKSILLINIHHIASDGWSGGVFQSELFVYYEAYVNKDTKFSLPSLEIQYKDYALWQRAYLTGEVLGQQLSYWKDKLSGYQNLEFPTDYARPNQTDYSGAYQEFTLTKKTSEKLRALAKDFGTTLHSVLLSSINILLGKYTGQDDIVIGSPIANRHHRQTEGLIGFFVNTQVNRTILGKAQSYQDLIHQVHQDQIAAQIHQDLPFEKLVEEMGVERDTSRHPIFQVMFGVQSFVGDSEQIDKQRNYFKPFQGSIDSDTEKFDLSIFIDDSQEELQGEISYATSLFHKDTIARLIDHYTYLLDQLVESPQQAYSKLGLLRPEEYNQIVHKWNQTDKDFPRDKTIHRLFEEQVEKTPDNIALVFQDQELTYHQLNEKSNQLARHIREIYFQRTGRHMQPDTLVPLCLDRGFEMVVAILAVLKTGAAYVPIDPDYPKERIDYILEDTKAEVVLSQRHLDRTNDIDPPWDGKIHVDLDQELYLKEKSSNLRRFCTPNNLAYVIYTSGTTGKPKGVMIEHKSVIDLSNWQKDYFLLDKPKRISQMGAFSFDASVGESVMSLTNGGVLVIIVKEDILQLVEIINQYNIDIIVTLPSILKQLEPDNLKNNPTIVSVGEKCPADLYMKWHKKCHFINGYGPTEYTVYSHTWNGIPNSNRVPIGKSRQNLKTYILDENMIPVPVGVAGEIYLSGPGLARGYLNNIQLTNEKFVPNTPYLNDLYTERGEIENFKVAIFTQKSNHIIKKIDTNLQLKRSIEDLIIEVEENFEGGLRKKTIEVIKDNRSEKEFISTFLRYYYEAKHNNYRTQSISWETFLTLTNNSLLPSTKVLDFGCGSGELIRCLYNNGVSDILGIDTNPYFVKNLLEDEINCILSRIDTLTDVFLKETNLKIDSFDFAVSTLTLDRVQHPHNLIKNMCAVLKEDARFILGTLLPIVAYEDGENQSDFAYTKHENKIATGINLNEDKYRLISILTREGISDIELFQIKTQVRSKNGIQDYTLFVFCGTKRKKSFVKQEYTYMYRAGDLARWLPDGNLEYIGRNDDQVKIRGYRIELGEIEHALTQVSGVKQSCVLARERGTETGSNKYLVGYYVVDSDGEVATQITILEKLSAVLPDYMVPSALVEMASFPLTINGKLDKRALPEPDFSSACEDYVAPATETETAICRIWQEVLGLDKVGITDDFFRIGGNSILAIRVSYRMNKSLGSTVKVADLFKFKTIDGILSICGQYSELAKPFQFNYNSDFSDMLFISPGRADSEMYQNLAEILTAKYNCIGIDNYNIHHKKKINSLNVLANYYLSEYEQNYALKEPINLLGWSLGGQIALEMAVILEMKGFKSVNVILLDTFISDEIMLNKRNQKEEDDFLIQERNAMLKKYEAAYVEKVISALSAERDLANSSISSHLNYTNVVLFKATQNQISNGNNSGNSKSARVNIKNFTANNVDLVADYVEVINLDCNHYNILETNTEMISNYLLANYITKIIDT